MVYAVLLLLLYVVQTTPGLFLFGGIKPLIIIPASITIAMVEGEFVGGIYGAFAGLLCDTAGSSLLGFNGLFISFFCILSGLLVIYLLRCNLLGCMMFTGVTLLVRGSVEFLFAYGMWGHDGVWRIYVFYTLPTVAYTLAATPLVFWAVRGIFRKFEKAIHP